MEGNRDALLLVGQLLRWQQAKSSRTVNIEFGTVTDEKRLKFWIYDFELSTGAFVSIGDSIPDLEALEKEKRLLEMQKTMIELTGSPICPNCRIKMDDISAPETLANKWHCKECNHIFEFGKEA